MCHLHVAIGVVIMVISVGVALRVSQDCTETVRLAAYRRLNDKFRRS